jgi:MYXO-CTERM domain-containing protein
VGDGCDVCPDAADDEQLDADQDGLGNACDHCPTAAGSASLEGCPSSEDLEGDAQTELRAGVERGCGCQSTSPWPWALLLGLCFRRRQRAHQCQV